MKPKSSLSLSTEFSHTHIHTNESTHANQQTNYQQNCVSSVLYFNNNDNNSWKNINSKLLPKSIKNIISVSICCSFFALRNCKRFLPFMQPIKSFINLLICFINHQQNGNSNVFLVNSDDSSTQYIPCRYENYYVYYFRNDAQLFSTVNN